jgi:hypothetical protein
MDYPVEWVNRVFTKSMRIQNDLVKPPKESDKTALIIEFRNEMFLLHVIRLFLYHLAPKGFRFLLLHGSKNRDLVKTFIEPLGVEARELPYDNLTPTQYTNLLKQKSFWESIPGEHILLYELDTYIRHGNIEPFLEYDYVGAPWEPIMCPWSNSKSRVGNGGLSLRRKSALLRCLDTYPPEDCPYRNDDRYFSEYCEDSMYLPSTEIARSFSVETWEHPDPLGFHKPWLYLPHEKIYPLLT